MKNIQILNYKQIQETFKELKVSKENFEKMQCKYIAINQCIMARGWPPSSIKEFEHALVGIKFNSAKDAEYYYYEHYIGDDDADGVYGVPVTENNEIVFIE